MTFAALDSAMAGFSRGLCAFNSLFPRYRKLRRGNPRHAELLRLAGDARQTAIDLITAADKLKLALLDEIAAENVETKP
jgi:hypothetical protein